jgi:hypothetical protein
MPLFECSKCHVVDNTALGNFWYIVMAEGKPALCAQCDPEIGAWHGKFDRVLIHDYRRMYPESEVKFPVLAWDAEEKV